MVPHHDPAPAATDGPLVGPVPAPQLHVMTFNIRRRMWHPTGRSPDLWSRRKGLIRRLLAAERPTVLSVQEALPDQADWVLAGLGPDYRRVGTGRQADGGGEGTPIFYDGQRLQLTGSNQWALSETPHRAGSRSWGNLVPRIAVAANFTDRETGAAFRVINTHLDHLSARSRLASARMLRRLVEDRPEPTVLTADANTGTRSRPYRFLTGPDQSGAAPLRDAWMDAEDRVTEEWGTFSNYRPPRRGGRRIDWILVDERFTVAAAGIHAARFDGAAASDHEPVQAVLALPGSTSFIAAYASSACRRDSWRSTIGSG